MKTPGIENTLKHLRDKTSRVQIAQMLHLVKVTEIGHTSKYWYFSVHEKFGDSFGDSSVGMSEVQLGSFFILSSRTAHRYFSNA